jgi:hypothetical protein
VKVDKLKLVADEVEYKVRDVTRYVVTRYMTVYDEATGKESSGCSVIGEYPSRELAEAVQEALQAQWLCKIS